jgi:methyl-accepting chemotaxis protein
MERIETKNYPGRKNYFIEKKFQAKFILKFSLLIIAAGILTIGILYFLTSRSSTVSFVNSRVVVKTTADFILPLLIQTIAVVVIVIGLATILVTLFISHKIYGPLYPFKKVMERLAEGDFSDEFRLRHSDQLKELASAFNNMITKLREDFKALKESFLSLQERLDDLKEEDIKEEKKQQLIELNLSRKNWEE